MPGRMPWRVGAPGLGACGEFPHDQPPFEPATRVGDAPATPHASAGPGEDLLKEAHARRAVAGEMVVEIPVDVDPGIHETPHPLGPGRHLPPAADLEPV